MAIKIAPKEQKPSAGERLIGAAKEMRGTVAKARAKTGPKPSGKAKVLFTMRIDPEALERWRASGPGYQARMNQVLKRYAP